MEFSPGMQQPAEQTVCHGLCGLSAFIEMCLRISRTACRAATGF
jgi:hypothetical protein